MVYQRRHWRRHPPNQRSFGCMTRSPSDKDSILQIQRKRYASFVKVSSFEAISSHLVSSFSVPLTEKLDQSATEFLRLEDWVAITRTTSRSQGRNPGTELNVKISNIGWEYYGSFLRTFKSQVCSPSGTRNWIFQDFGYAPPREVHIRHPSDSIKYPR